MLLANSVLFFPLRTAPIYIIYISTQNLNMVDCEDWAHCKEELVGGKREEVKVLHSQCFHHQSKIKDKVGNQICYWNKFCSSVFTFLFIFPRKRSALSKLSSFLAGTQTTILAFLWRPRLKRKTNTPTEAKHSLWRCATTSYLYPESFCLLNLAGSNCSLTVQTSQLSETFYVWQDRQDTESLYLTCFWVWEAGTMTKPNTLLLHLSELKIHLYLKS